MTLGRRLVGAALIIAAAIILWTQYRELSALDLLRYAKSWGVARIAVAVAFCVASFALLGLLEWLGLNWSGVSLRLRAAMVGSTIVNGITHSLGANVVIAAFARTWAYRRTGLQLLPSATTTLFTAVSFTLGLAVMVGLGLCLGLASTTAADVHTARLGLSGEHLLAAFLLGLPVAYVAACAIWPMAPLMAHLRLPTWPLALGQVGIGFIDTLLGAAILWILIGADVPPFSTFVIAYAVASLIGLASFSPGGLGVFEASLLIALPSTPPEALAAGMIGYRLIFYLLPLIVAAGLVALSMTDEAPPRPDRLNPTEP